MTSPITSYVANESFNLGEKIARQRHRRRVTQEQLARAMKVARVKIAWIETGRIKQVDFDLLQRMCTYLKISAEDLLGVKLNIRNLK